jgi:phosphoglycolate phosphatase
MKYRWLVWDFDGTLVDTFEVAWRTYNKLAVRHGWQPIEDAHAMKGMTARAFMRKQNISLAQLPVMAKHFLRAQRQNMESVRVFPGLRDVLYELKRQGRRLGVLSSNSKENIQACLLANEVQEVFDFVVGYPRLFGKARAMRRSLRREQARAEEWLYVGDEVRDVQAARKAGVDVVAVTWGYQTASLLRRHEPTYLITEPTQILTSVVAGR